MLVLGVVLALAGAAAFAAMNTAIRHGVRPGSPDDGLFTTVVVNIVFFSAVVVVLIASGRLGPINPLGVGVFMAAGFGTSFLGRGLLFGSIHRIGAVRGSAIKNATPLVTLVIALGILGEQLTASAALGVAIVLSGVFLLVRETLRLANHQARERVAADPLAAAVEVDVPENDALEREAAPGRRYGRQAMRASAARWRADRDMRLVVGITLALLCTLVLGVGHALRKVGMEIMPDALLASTIGSWTAFTAYVFAAAGRRRLSDAFGSAFLRPRRSFWIAGLLSSLGQLAMFAALDVAPVSIVSVVGGSEAILTVVFAALILGRAELITRRVVIPAVLVFLGSAIIAVGP